MIQYKCKGYILTFLGILLAAVVVIILCSKALKIYLRKFSLDKGTEKLDTDALDRQTIADRTRKEIEHLDRQLLDRTKQLKDLR